MRHCALTHFFSNRRSWNLEPVELLQFGLIVQARVCPLVRWSPGPLVLWSAGPLVRWSPAVRWSTGPLVPWSSGPSWIRYMLCKANKEANQQARKQASKQARAAHLWIWCVAGGGRCGPPQPPRTTKSALHPRHPHLPRNQYFKQKCLTNQICLLYLSMYLSIHVSFYRSYSFGAETGLQDFLCSSMIQVMCSLMSRKRQKNIVF